MNGILPVVKPGGMTSHDVVARIRRTLSMRRVGHTGTLDPDATGVLVILLGKATRLMQFMVTLPKTYLAGIVLGITTDTFDASGQVTARTEDTKVSKERFLEALSDFRGEIWQIPPMVSAVHHKGRRLYELAREGIEAPRRPRLVHIHTLEVKAWPEKEFLRIGDEVSVLVECSSGTYIRQLAADLGENLGCGAHIGSLSRTKVGSLDIASCYTLEEVEKAAECGSFQDMLLPISEGLSHLPAIILAENDKDMERRVSAGACIQMPEAHDEIEGQQGRKCLAAGDFVSVVASSGDVLCVARLEMSQGKFLLHPVVVFA